MKSILAMVPSVNGHYLRYVEKVRSRGIAVEVVQCSDSDLASLKRMLFLGLPRPKRSSLSEGTHVLGLHGEVQILHALIHRLIFGRRVTLLFYYGFSRGRGAAYWVLAAPALLMLRLSGVRLAYLEGCVQLFAPPIAKHFFYVPDFPMDGGSLSGPVGWSSSKRKVLLAGYIDERKNFRMLCDALRSLCLEDASLEIELSVVGAQSDEAKAFFLKFEAPKNLRLRILDRRVSAGELASEIEASDIIWALYANHVGSSGMFLNAVAADKWVIFRPVGVLENFRAELNISQGALSGSESSLGPDLLEIFASSNRQYHTVDRERFLEGRTEKHFLDKIMGG